MKTFPQFLKSIKPELEGSTVNKYDTAIKGTLAGFIKELIEMGVKSGDVDNRDGFSKICEKTSNGEKIKEADDKGHNMYRRAIVYFLHYYESEYISEQEKFNAIVQLSQLDEPLNRLKRLEIASTKPVQYTTKTIAYKRNPDVIAECLSKADGICCLCKSKATFKSKFTGKPYLEVHHSIALSEGGTDDLSNVMALCPNCHRKLHYGESTQQEDVPDSLMPSR